MAEGGGHASASNQARTRGVKAHPVCLDLSHQGAGALARAVPLLRARSMTMVPIKVTIRIAWWVRRYISVVALCSLLTGLEPDIEKVKATAMNGVRLS